MDGMDAGYQEIEHTADWELHVWAPDLPGLLEQAARGMYALSGVKLQDGPRLQARLELEAYDAEGLLVKFLSELLYLGGQQAQAFDTFYLDLKGLRLNAILDGAPLISVDKEIKAVTYHHLNIRKTEVGLEVNIVFDV